jgi:V8-like Glu-specific endopeptidase
MRFARRKGMRQLLPLLVLAAAAVACTSSASNEEGDDESVDATEDQLRRYEEDSPFERPEVGLVRIAGAGYCTGTLIGPRTVLTAAHCVDFGSSVAPPSAPALGTFTVLSGDGRMRVAHSFHRYRADAGMLNVKFDIAVIQLDVAVGATLATPATIAEEWPRERLTVYGFGRYGAGCKNSDASPTKRKTTVPPSFPFVKATTCPGDSGGPYFRGTSNAIVATVKGDGLGLEWVGDAVQHREWILERRAESERGVLNTAD